MDLRNWEILCSLKRHPPITIDEDWATVLAWAVEAVETKLGLLLLWKPVLDLGLRHGAQVCGAVSIC